VKQFPEENISVTQNNKRKLPPWLKTVLSANNTFTNTEQVISKLGLETICSSANCPNRGQCWSRGTAAVLILGKICTRNCRFCSIEAGKPEPPDATEPLRLAQMAKRMNLKYTVITSVNRDDLPDGGATHFRDCINETRKQCPDMKFEILTGDFRDCQKKAIEILYESLPFVFAHNMETVPSLYKKARAGGDYQRSLNLLKMARDIMGDITTKSSIMLGLGECDEEVIQVLEDLRKAGCDRITIGQYLKPSKNSLDVAEYITPEKFDWWKQKALDTGFSWVMSSPFARSSYFAEIENTMRL
jgi:lipoic acid synthetase